MKNTKEKDVEPKAEVHAVEAVIIRDMLFKKIPEPIIQGWDKLASLCNMTRSDFLIEVYDRIDPIYKKIKYLADRKSKAEEAELMTKKRKKRRT